ncbi:hypothetical protein VTJ83DRAFT_6133 [Remersonia thermophila]|uniref:Nephrocystin 3-like N-terminal domain-containing protein n=1 Tax=Remersonia thermophila TaxID=72144 RepID=A0ABR4DAD1_9PEZI
MARALPTAQDDDAKSVSGMSDSSVESGFTMVTHDRVPARPAQANEKPQDLVKKLLDWLQPTDYLSPGGEYQKHLRAHVPGTGAWVQGTSTFRKWMGMEEQRGDDKADNEADDDEGEEEDGEMVEVVDLAKEEENEKNEKEAEPPSEQGSSCVLHVRGVAGSGKSVFSARTIQQLQEPIPSSSSSSSSSSSAGGRIVLFFFFRQIVDHNHTSRYLARDYAAQLLPHSPSLRSALEKLSKDHAVRGNELSLIWPAVVEALELDAPLLGGRVFCVADALDEMDEADLEDMVASLAALGARRSGKPALARVLMTSRPLTRIESVVRRSRGVARMRLDPARLSSDVGRYVDARMEELLRGGLLGDGAEEKRDLIRQTICGRANGLFLHARLAIDNLAQGLREGRVDPAQLPQQLDELLPSTLRGVYEGMLREHARRTGSTADQQAQMLACVTRASRPLRLIELGSLAARLMCGGDLRRGKDLVRAGCGKFLELLEDETVSVIHHSFTEFLNDEERRGDAGPGAFPVLDDSEAHAALAVLLLDYLDGCPHYDGAAMDDRRTPASSPEEERRRQLDWKSHKHTVVAKARSDTRVAHPLVEYASSNLVFHMGKVPPGTPQAGRVLAALDRCFLPGRPAVETWMLENWYGPMSASCGVLHLLAGYAWEAPAYVVEHLAGRDPALVDAPDAAALTPLAYAADRGHAEIVRLLLARGADPTSGRGSDDGLTPLHRAVQHNRTAVVRLMLAAGADPLSKWWPAAVRFDEWPRTEEEIERERRSALAYAFTLGRPDMVRQFLPFVPPDEANRCFHASRDLDIVRAVLETGNADVDSFCSGMTKLFCAARLRDAELVRLLLAHGADPRRRCSNEDSIPFQWSTMNITSEVPHPHRERGPTPLHAFVGVGPPSYHVDPERTREELAECLRLLVEAGADVNARMDSHEYSGERDLTPLHFAVRMQPCSDSFYSFFDEAERPRDKMTAEMFVELLLAAGADVNAQTVRGNTPLHLARPARPGIAGLLLEHGADANARNVNGNTPLHVVRSQDLELVELLTAHGADVNARNAEGRAPMAEIMFRGRLTWNPNSNPKSDPAVLLRLLELGADPDQADDDGNTALRHLVQGLRGLTALNLPPLVEELLRAGADPNRKNRKGEPLLWGLGYSSERALDPQDEEVLRRLVAGGLDLDARHDGEGQTALFSMVKNGNLVKLDLLLRLGADPLARDGRGRTLLHVSAEHGGLAVPALLAAGVPAEAVDDEGRTVIHALVSGAKRLGADGCGVLREPLEALIKAGARPLARDAQGRSVLHLAGSQEFMLHLLGSPHFAGLDAVRGLLRAGADVDAAAATGLSALHVAAGQGDGNAVSLLLARYREQGTLAGHVNRLGGAGGSPLHHACRSGAPAAVSELLRCGADASLADEKGLTPLHRAGADVNAEAAVPAADGTATRSVTPLDLAVEGRCWGMVRRLLAHGAAPRDRHRQSEAFLLATDKERAAEKARQLQAALPPRARGQEGTRWLGRWAVCAGSGSPEDVFGRVADAEPYPILVPDGQALLEAVEEEGGYGWHSVLHDVLAGGDYDSIKEYAELGGTLLQGNTSSNETFLHHIVENGHTDLVERFADKVAELEAQEQQRPSRDRAGTLLGTACRTFSPSLDMVQLLVDKLGVDVNAVHDPKNGYDYEGSALHLLAKGGAFWKLEAIEFLLSRGADIEARNGDGMTPLLVAASAKPWEGAWREEAVRVLLKHGADVNAAVLKEDGTWGATPLQLSAESGIGKLLLEHGATVQPGLLSRAVAGCTDADLVRLLLDAGADPNGVSPPADDKKKKEEEEEEEGDGEAETEARYAIHEAARPKEDHHSQACQEAVIELLLSRGADAYALYPDGSFALQAIVEDRCAAQPVLARLSRPNHDLRGRGGRTLLASACMPLVPALDRWAASRRGEPTTVMADVVQTLVDARADALLPDDEGRVPLHWFCTYASEMTTQHRDAFCALVRHGPAAIDVADAQGQKPLHLALAAYASGSQKSIFMVQHLLAAGADPADADPRTGDTALHCIAPRLVGSAAAAAEAAALFREVAARVDINRRNKAGETAAFSFAAAGFESTRDPEGIRSVADYSLEHDTMHAAAVDVLVSLGADLTAVDARGRNLLHVTAGREAHVALEVDVVGAFKKLVALGLDPRAEDDQLRTPIDVAVARNWRGIVQLFSEEGDGGKLKG